MEVATHGVRDVVVLSLVRGLTSGFATLPKVARSLQWSKQGWKTLGELGVSKSMEYDTFSLQCSDTVGWGPEGHPACRKVGVG